MLVIRCISIELGSVCNRIIMGLIKVRVSQKVRITEQGQSLYQTVVSFLLFILSFICLQLSHLAQTSTFIVGVSVIGL